MPIEAGATLPDATLFESLQHAGGCPVAPRPVSVVEAARGKTVVLVGLIGAFTDTCTLQHVPGYVQALDELRALGVDEVWLVAVNDGFVMGQWRDHIGAPREIRFLGDGSGQLTRKLGLEVTIPGMGLRLERCSLLVEDGVVKRVNVEQPMALEVSDAKTMLAQLAG